MKSKSNSDFSPSQPHLPSAVPISVYKELAAELQATRAMIESLNNRNQQLVQQNQMIRQEVERVVQASFNLQQIVDFTTPPENGLNQTIADLSASLNPGLAPSPQNHLPMESDPLQVSPGARPPFNELFTEEPSRPQSIQKQSKDLGNMGILLTVLIVVLTAFGLGFLAVKQLLPSR
jgi:TolA-binding protein